MVRRMGHTAALALAALICTATPALAEGTLDDGTTVDQSAPAFPIATPPASPAAADASDEGSVTPATGAESVAAARVTDPVASASVAAPGASTGATAATGLPAAPRSGPAGSARAVQGQQLPATGAGMTAAVAAAGALAIVAGLMLRRAARPIRFE